MPLIYENSFASQPMASMWSRDNKVTPDCVTKSSHQRFKFDCKYCKHSFFQSPNTIKDKAKYCPFCTNKKLCGDINCEFCMEKSFMYHELAMDWDTDKNQLMPFEVTNSCHKKFNFICSVCKHEVITSPNYIDNGNYCAYCANKKLCGKINCDSCLQKSFASCEYSVNWSDKNDISPIDIFKTSHKKYIFNCPNKDCSHEFTAALSDIYSGYLCSYCGKKKLCDDMDCLSCYKKSFLSSPYVLGWSDKNKESPRQIFKNSEKSYIFYCDKCKHEFERSPLQITQRGFCLYCSTQHPKICDDSNCVHCLNRSFASHKMAKQWSDKNNLLPRQITKCSSVKFIFDCHICNNEFKIRPIHILGGSWCPCVKRKSEKILEKFLNKNYDIQIKTNKRFVRCKNIRYLPFDFFLKEYKLIIELDGDQHFKQVSSWKNYRETQKIDIYKMEAANKKGYSIIRIYQMDVWRNKNNWIKRLMNAIKLVKKYHQKFPINILIGKIYNNHPIYNFQP